jgi:hypothetical protein
MPAAPDIQYFLDCSVECLHITNDTHWYFMYHAEDVNEYIDAYSSRGRRQPRGNHMHSLADTGLYCEERLIEWRKTRPEERIAASRAVYEHTGSQVGEFIRHYSGEIVDLGMTKVTDAALRRVDKRYGLWRSIQVLKRGCVRAYNDLEGYSAPELDRALQMSNDLWDIHQQNRVVALDNLRRTLGTEARVDDAVYRERDVQRAASYLRQQIKQDRKVVRRSVAMSEKLLGKDTTRLFIGGGKIKIEGKHCIYEIEKTGKILSSHGGAKLSVFTKQDDIHLCNLCIYTPDVPLMDHVASIILHIKANEEDEILKTGNAYGIAPVAYDQDWLVPHLPPMKSKDTSGLEGMIRGHLAANGHVIIERPEREARLRDVRPVISKIIFDALGEYAPPMPMTKAIFMSGRDWLGDREAVAAVTPNLLGEPLRMSDPAGRIEMFQ